MKTVSAILIVIGLLITVAGNLTNRYALNAFNKAIEESAHQGTGAMVAAMEMAFTSSTVSLIGCFLLVVGIALAALSRKQQPRAASA